MHHALDAAAERTGSARTARSGCAHSDRESGEHAASGFVRLAHRKHSTIVGTSPGHEEGGSGFPIVIVIIVAVIVIGDEAGAAVLIRRRSTA